MAKKMPMKKMPKGMPGKHMMSEKEMQKMMPGKRTKKMGGKGKK